jgi:ATP-dependent RNA helicase RhlE
VYHVPKAAKPQLLAHVIRSQGITRGLVFVRTKHGADRVARKLAQCGIAAQAIHGNKSQGQRERAIKAFKGQSPPVLVATDIAARGLDIDDVSHVVNYDLPNVPETYVHRIGRTARAGASGVAISFCDGDEREYLRDIERLTRQRITVKDDAAAREEIPQRPQNRRPLEQQPTPQAAGHPRPRQDHRPRNDQPRSLQPQRRRFQSGGPLPAPGAMPEHGYRRQGGKRPHRKGQRRVMAAR